MEIQGQDDDDDDYYCGSETFVLREGGSKEVLGRGGFGSSDPNDRFVSRRHVSLQLQLQPEEDDTSPSLLVVRFEVIGRNPIWVFDHSTEEIQTFRRSEKGKLEAGDKFCLSSNRPVWLGLKRIKLDEKTKSAVTNENDLSRQRLHLGGFGHKGVDDLELESIDISEIDPVKEFGFLVLGHEFDKFPQKMVCGGNNWNWFLEEPKGKSEDDESSSYQKRKKKGVRSTRKKRDDDDDDDDEWKGESDEEDDQAIMKLRKVVGGAKYSTRSMGGGNSSKNNKHHEVRTVHVNEDDEEDETLGGFIVTDDDDEEEEVVVEDEEEEEEFH
ncbi:uncharacterized protein LOC124920553 [Impatiens glandulifera]|uniref:uncharacterized protein LOC124920553 n=1 Tax=Impatiens glandulifera TaxID=253017 RepID=UPI001FB167DD|nr:uncharacterized protein LOC124920553 [Impatiens glandulifera]